MLVNKITKSVPYSLGLYILNIKKLTVFVLSPKNYVDNYCPH